jgi:lysophospholipase L1-like esterase
MMHVAARLALAPVLYAQAARMRRTAVRMPVPPGPCEGLEGDGPVRLRLLVAGDSSAAGVGAPSQQQALALPLARRLTRQLDGAVSWQLVAASGLTSQGVLQALMGAATRPADVAVIVCGANDITKERPLPEAIRWRQHIAAWLRSRCGVAHALFTGLPPMEIFPAIPYPLSWYSGLMARMNNRLQARWAADAASSGVVHVEMDGIVEPALFCHDGFHPGPAIYARVVERLTERICVCVQAAAPPRQAGAGGRPETAVTHSLEAR